MLDFGISKQATSGADAGVTKTQAVLGSPRYMSPEQMRSTKDVDARADVWALGAVVHELVAGQPPFDADTMTALCAAILQDPPRSMRVTRPDAPPELEAVVRAALEKDRDRRYANVAQFAAALAPFGSASSLASAQRIARVLGLPAGGGMPPGYSTDPRLSPSGVRPPARMTGTTGGSGSISSEVRGSAPSGAAIAAAIVAVLVFAAAGTVGVVAWKRHAAEAIAPALPPPTASVVVAPPAPPSAPVVLAEPEPTPSAAPSASAAPPASSAAAPAVAPVRRPSVGPRPAGAPQPAKPPSNGNPFGDDRRG